MTKWNYASNDEILTNIQLAALNNISMVINDWDGLTAEAKVNVIQGILCMVADVDEQISIEKNKDADK
jgi:hypothetical protein